MSERSIRRLMTAIHDELDSPTYIPTRYFEYFNLTELVAAAANITNVLIRHNDPRSLDSQYKLRKLLHNDKQLATFVGALLNKYSASVTLNVLRAPVDLAVFTIADILAAKCVPTNFSDPSIPYDMLNAYSAIETLCLRIIDKIIPSDVTVDNLRIHHGVENDRRVLSLWFESNAAVSPLIYVTHNIVIPFDVFSKGNNDMVYGEDCCTKHAVGYMNRSEAAEKCEHGMLKWVHMVTTYKKVEKQAVVQVPDWP